MESLHLLFSNPLIALFAIVGIGLLIGNIQIKGISLGSSGVLFVALLAGALGYGIPDGVGKIGLVIFVYCVGIGAGGRFFGALMREGSTLAKLALIIVVVGAAVTYLLAYLLDIPPALAVGIFAGALTSTPALAAATEGPQAIAQEVVIGYGIAYPFGVIGVVLFIQLLPKLLKKDLDSLAADHKDPAEEEGKVEKVLVEVTNTNLFGQNISESRVVTFNACQVSRILHGDRLRPLTYDDKFEEGQHVLLIGRSKEIALAIDHLGKRSDKSFIADVENERQRLVVRSKDIVGKSLHELKPLKNHNVIITRITRLDFTFVPNADTRIENFDVLTVVGRNEDLKTFADTIKHRNQSFDETDLLSLSIGLTLGIIAGIIPIGLPGGKPLTLGLAGGPLFVALLLGHFGKVGRIVGHIPRPTRMLLQELGLVLFLANAGIKGGGSLWETLLQYGPMLFIMGCIITLVPMILAFFIAGRWFKLNPLQALGGICGGMTSTPALGAITAKTDSQLPVVSYATAYPVALIMMTVFAKMLLQLLMQMGA